jgi:glutathione synthase/RimK-type ligase-like ATP-grasp enzyme
MIAKNKRRIGLIVGSETEFPEAFITAVNQRNEDVMAELVQIGGTFMDAGIPYDVIIDRMSHEAPYYRAYLKYAVLQGCYVINNPFVLSADSKFYGIALVNQLGMTSPRTVALPNKYIRLQDLGPDAFRNLIYPMDWEGIIAYVGGPAIFKDINSGGKHVTYRVHNVDELIERYDESGTHTMILQQWIESDVHIHCLVIGQQATLAMQYDAKNCRYMPEITAVKPNQVQKLVQDAVTLTRAYQYDINTVEFVLTSDQTYVTNSTNPTPGITQDLMTAVQFNWCIEQMVDLAMARAHQPRSQKALHVL